MSTVRFRAVTAPDGNPRSDGKYFDDLLYSRADVNAPYSDWLFGSMGKFHKVRKVARTIPRGMADAGARVREFESRFGSQFAK